MAQQLRTPQARVLHALLPDFPDLPSWEWAPVSRPWLARKAGYTGASGTITRALSGVREGSSSCAPHLGLLALGYVEEVILDVEGVKETTYRITKSGLDAYQEHVRRNGKLPEPRDAASYTNKRYKGVK